MSTTSPTPSFDPGLVNPKWKDSSGLTTCLHEVSLFLRSFRSRMKVGELSRSPLRLISFQLSDRCIRCDWIAREPDPWDAELSPHVGQRHASLQALKDAINARSLIFASIPDADHAHIRAFRRNSDDLLELVISGALHRSDGAFRDTHSLVMRAKLLGFRFDIQNDILLPMREEQQSTLHPL